MRYRDYGQLDDKPVLDGDSGFVGINTENDRSYLGQGTLSKGENIRLEKGCIETRNGYKRFTDKSINTTIVGNDFLDAIAISESNENTDSVLCATKDSGYYLKSDGTNSTISYPPTYDNLTKAFLIDTKVSTLLFSDPGPTLPVKLDFILGDQVSRLNQDKDKFELYKQADINSIQDLTSDGLSVSVENHFFNEGETVVIHGTNTTIDRVFKVESSTDDTITLVKNDNQVFVPPGSATGGIIYSLDDGCPCAEFATFTGNRLIVPTGQDELRISSPLSTTTFPIYNRVIISSSETGNIQALEPMADDSMIIFKNHSIYLMTGLYDMKSTAEGGRLGLSRITNQLGCLSKKSIQVVGDEIIFHSPQGIYALTLNAQGAGGIGLSPQAIRIADQPLSTGIDNLVQNDSANTDTFSSFYLGRYYYGNGLELYLYNTKLKAWESVDNIKYPLELNNKTVNTFLNDQFKSITINSADGLKLLIMSKSAGLLQYGSDNDIDDDIYHETNYGIDCQIETREYKHNTIENKHYRRSLISWETDGSKINAQAFTFVPELITDLIKFTDSSGEDVEQNGRHQTRSQLRARGESMYIKISNLTDKKIKIKTIAIEASTGSRTTVDRN